MATKNKYGIDLDTAIAELQTEIEDAVDFVQSEYMEGWEEAEEYYNGKTSIPTVTGRSKAVKTEVRDAIRGVMPSVMRTLLQERKPVVYLPNNAAITGAFLDQQALFVNQEFTRNNGYKHVYNAVLQSLKLKGGPVKTFWYEDPLPEFFKFTRITAEAVEFLRADPTIDLEEVEESIDDEDDVLTSEGIPLYDVEGYRYHENGKVAIESFPVWELFFSRNANSLEDAFVHGHRRSVTVGEAIELDLEYDNWLDLDDEDPELNDAVGVVTASKGITNTGEKQESEDLTQHRFLLTECYCQYDLKGTGKPQRYCFWFGGTSYEYLDHEEIEDYCIDVVCTDPIPFSVLGHSFYDLLHQNQDIQSSILRAVLDNAHLANTPRYVGDPMRINFTDLMNHTIGAPIKSKGEYMPKVIDIPFTGQQLLPLLGYMDQDTEEKVGVTKAATGLDPNAMQSTDKDAVRNTIELAQGQVELIVRNIVEHALISVFRRVLRLTVRHFDGSKVVQTQGKVVPVPPGALNPDLAAVPNVGLGTTRVEQRQGTLGFIMQKQEQYMQQFGFDNPFTSMSQLYNTLEDMVTSGGIVDIGRYFNIIDQQTEQKIAQQMNEAKKAEADNAAKNAPVDPAKAMLSIENTKARLRELEITLEQRNAELELAQKALKDAEDNDYKRDKLIQDRVIKFTELRANAMNQVVQQEQKANDSEKQQGSSTSSTSGEKSS